jgi:hypothetical protein
MPSGPIGLVFLAYAASNGVLVSLKPAFWFATRRMFERRHISIICRAGVLLVMGRLFMMTVSFGFMSFTPVL